MLSDFRESIRTGHLCTGVSAITIDQSGHASESWLPATAPHQLGLSWVAVKLDLYHVLLCLMQMASYLDNGLKNRTTERREKSSYQMRSSDSGGPCSAGTVSAPPRLAALTDHYKHSTPRSPEGAEMFVTDRRLDHQAESTNELTLEVDDGLDFDDSLVVVPDTPRFDTSSWY